MKRVFIGGIPGAGKSTLARKVGGKLGLPVCYLDHLYHADGWNVRPEAEARKDFDALAETETWVAEGIFKGLSTTLMARADMIVFLDFPGWYAVLQLFRRWFLHITWLQRRPDLKDGASERLTWEFITWTWNWPQTSRLKWLAEFEKHPGKVITFTRRKDVNAWLKTLPEQGR
jgi:adenylate kinase family enzyme